MRTSAAILTATLLAAVCVQDGGAHASGFVSDPGCPYRVAATAGGRDKIDVTRLFKDADLVVLGTVVKATVNDKKAGAGVLTVRIAARVKGLHKHPTLDVTSHMPDCGLGERGVAAQANTGCGGDALPVGATELLFFLRGATDDRYRRLGCAGSVAGGYVEGDLVIVGAQRVPRARLEEWLRSSPPPVE